MERGNVVRFYFLAHYHEGIEPWQESEAGKPPRIGQSIEIVVDPDQDLGQQMRLAIDADPDFRSPLKDALGKGYDRLALLPRGSTPEQWTYDGSLSGSANSINWWIDPFFQTVMAVDLLHRYPYLTLTQLDELVDLQLVDGDPRELLVLIDTGLGGGDGFSDLAEWLLEHGIDIGIGYVGERILSYLVESVTRRFRGSVRDRRAKRLAALWERNNFFRPKDLREFIDVRAEWDLAQIERLLALTPVPARKLLRSLGYEPSRAGHCRTSTRWRAQRRRREWLRDEDDQSGFDDLVQKGQR